MATTLNFNLGGSNSSPFNLSPGRYVISALATSWASGSLDLQILGADQATYISLLGTNTLKANGVTTLDLPAGTFKLVVATATGVQVSVGATTLFGASGMQL